MAIVAFLELGHGDTNVCEVVELFEFIYRHRHLAGEVIHRLVAQQAQHDFFLPPSRPPLHFAGRAGPAATPSTFDSFSIPQLLFQTRFNPKVVSRKIRGGSVTVVF